MLGFPCIPFVFKRQDVLEYLLGAWILLAYQFFFGSIHILPSP